MSHQLGEKAVDVLLIAQCTHEDRPDLHYAYVSPTRDLLLKKAYRRWGTNVVLAKFDSLARRGYIEYGVSPRTGWLTDKGRTALAQSAQIVRNPPKPSPS